MRAYTYLERGVFRMTQKPRPVLRAPRDTVVRVTLASICTSDVHIRNGAVPRAVPGITVGHEFVGVVEETGSAVTHVKKGDRVAVNVETYCGTCFFCRHGWVNNCSDPNGGWALGCRIDGGLAEYARIPFADTNLVPIPDGVTDEQALFTGDLLSTGYWAAKIAHIRKGDTVLLIGAGPTGYCTALCALLHSPARLIVCETDPVRRAFFARRFPNAEVLPPEDALPLLARTPRGGADAVIEAAGSAESFRLAWQGARPNANVVLVAMYETPQILPLPDIYGKNLTFKTGGVDGCDCSAVMRLIAEGRLDATPLITHTFPFSDIERAFSLFAQKKDGVLKVAVRMDEDIP